MEGFSNQASSQHCFITIAVYLSLSHVLKLILFKFDLLLKMGTTSYRDVDRFWLVVFFFLEDVKKGYVELNLLQLKFET